MKKKKIICFDLDGTLAPSKQRIDDEMADLINNLLKKFHVCVITGGGVDRFDKQIFEYITTEPELLQRFIPCPTCGTKMYRLKNYIMKQKSQRNRLIIIKQQKLNIQKYQN